VRHAHVPVPRRRWTMYAIAALVGSMLAIPGAQAQTAPEVVPIGRVQGSVGDGDNPLTHRSPVAPPSGNSSSTTMVRVQGVITSRTLAKTAAGAAQNGFFIQNTAATADTDPNSSDGLFVFMGTFTSLIGGYVPRVGDEVVVEGRIAEFFNLTEMTGARGIAVVRTGVDLDAEVPAFDVAPPDDLDAANRYWERREGMRARVPAGGKAVDGRDVFPGTADGEVWLIRGDHPVARRSDPYDRRVFRDPHPLDNIPDQLFDDGNGYRILLGSLGVKASAGDLNLLIAPVRNFDTVTNALTGGVYFSFNKYQIQVTDQPVVQPGPDPARNLPRVKHEGGHDYTVADYNVENLYDFRDDPFDGCDFAGNAGCPGVNPPFDFVPASAEAYEHRVGEIASQIVDDLDAPDLILTQEIEDQDICTVDAGRLACGATDDADGSPDALQELALAIVAAGGPAYGAAYDRDGADDRGITSAFLYRRDRVTLVPPTAGHPILGGAPTVRYRGAALGTNADVQNPKTLNAVLPADVDRSTGVDGANVFTRAPQVGQFRVWPRGIGRGKPTELYALSNHFSSGPDARVGQRTEQAAYDAALVAAIQAADRDARVIVGGDFNVYPRPDDPFAPGHPLFPSDQLGPLYRQGLTNLWDVLAGQDPDGAYSYVFQGQTQTLDSLFVTDQLRRDLEAARSAQLNSDWPADFDGDAARGLSDHDPQLARFKG
jgi:predicted extracellular nuclease